MTKLGTLLFQYLFFHVEDNGILVEYVSFFLTLPNFDFITAQSSLITAQMDSVTPYYRPWVRHSVQYVVHCHAVTNQATESFGNSVADFEYLIKAEH